MNIYVYKGHLVGAYGKNFREDKVHDTRLTGVEFLGNMPDYYYDYNTEEILEKGPSIDPGLQETYQQGQILMIPLLEGTRVIMGSLGMHEDFYLEADETLEIELVDVGEYSLRIYPVATQSTEHWFTVV
jgi:hypothetical protein